MDVSTWARRLGKVRRHLGQRDLSGLAGEVQRYRAWLRAGKAGGPAGAEEAAYWDHCDAELARKVSWTNAADFGVWVFEDSSGGRWSTQFEMVAEKIQVPRTQLVRGLVLGCGDMVSEHTWFVNPLLPFDEVDAYDVSPKSIERARQLTDEKGLKVNYHLADVNRIELPVDRYALVVTSHAFHHFEAVDRIARQINRALLPGGVFSLVDYIGPRRLQFSRRQLFYAQLMLEALPEQYRRTLDGTLRRQVQSVPVGSLSADEAIRSDEIMPAIARHMRIVWQQSWAGLLYPLLDGLGANFDRNRCEDQVLVRFLYNLDRHLCQIGEVESNFAIVVATKK